MSNLTSTSQLSPAVLQSFSYNLLPSPESELIYNIPASYERMPAGGGTTLVMRRYNNLSAALSPLGNSGQTPAAQQQTASDIQATMEFYGTYVYVNEQVVLQNQEDVLAGIFLRLQYSAALTEDNLIRDMLASTASIVNAVGGVNGDNPSELTSSDFDDVEKILLGNNARKFTPAVMGSDRYGSAPIQAAYLFLGHTDLSSNLKQMDDFVPYSRYSAPEMMSVAEYGSIGAFRCLLSSEGSKSANASNLGNDVYNNIVCGWDAFGTVKMDEYNLEAVYLPPQFSGPLALNASLGWKAAIAPVIKNDAWVVNFRSTAAA